MQARNPAARQSSVEARKVQFSGFGVREGQVRRQNIPVEDTQTQTCPSWSGFLSDKAR